MQATVSQGRGRRRAGDARPSGGGLGRAIRYLGKQRRPTLIAYGALFIATAAQLAVPQLVQNMIDAATNGVTANALLTKVPSAFLPNVLDALNLNKTVEQLQADQANAETLLISAALFIVAFAVMRGLFSFVQAYMSERVSQGVAFDFRNEIFSKIQRLSFTYQYICRFRWVAISPPTTPAIDRITAAGMSSRIPRESWTAVCRSADRGSELAVRMVNPVMLVSSSLIHGRAKNATPRTTAQINITTSCAGMGDT